MTLEKDEKAISRNDETTLYELGYHLVPFIAPEMLGGDVTSVKDLVESSGGVIVSDEFPKAMTLAYPLSRMIENKKKIFTSSYFGWMRFQMSPGKLPSLDQELGRNEKIIRFLLIKTSNEKPLSSRRVSFLGRGRQPILGLGKKEKEDTAPKKVEPKMTEEEIQKTIEELVGE